MMSMAMQALLTELAQQVADLDVKFAKEAAREGNVSAIEKIWDELATLAIEADELGNDFEVEIYLTAGEQVFEILENTRKVHQGFDSYFADSLEELEELGLGIFISRIPVSDTVFIWR